MVWIIFYVLSRYVSGPTEHEVSSCPCVIPQSCSLRCDVLLGPLMLQLLNPCLHCGHGSAVVLSPVLWIAHLSQGTRATAGTWQSVQWATWELIWCPVLCAYSDLCAYRDSRPAFCQTNLCRMGLQVFCAKEYVRLQDFSLQDHFPCDCNVCLQPFLKMLLAKAAYKVQHRQSILSHSCQISLEMLRLRLLFVVLPSRCVSIPERVTIGMLSARMDSEGWEYVHDNWIEERSQH